MDYSMAPVLRRRVISPSNTYFSVTPNTAEGTAFVSRALTAFPSLDSTHQSAYLTLINSLVNNGVWSAFDILYVFAAQDASVAVLNLVSSSFTCIANGSPTFTADNGYTGVDASTTVYLDTQWDPFVLTPKYSQNNAHISAWANTNAASSAGGGAAFGHQAQAGSVIWPKYSDNNAYYWSVDIATGPSSGIPISDPRGLHTAARNGATSQFGYFNASDQGVTPVASATDSDHASWRVLMRGQTNDIGYGGQVMSCSAGSYLTSTQVTNFYNALHAYLVTIAGIGY